jgi:hypothetical protein
MEMSSAIKYVHMQENSRFLGINQQERINSLVQDENYKYWLGGFAEGEGALVISVVKNDKTTRGIVLQPEFNVAQHVNGLSILYSFKSLFENFGHVSKKSGSEKVWVFSIKGTKNIKKYVLPYFDKYLVPYSSKYRSDLFKDFCHIIDRLDENKKKTMDKKELIELIKLVYLLNPDGKGKHRKRTLEETISMIKD